MQFPLSNPKETDQSFSGRISLQHLVPLTSFLSKGFCFFFDSCDYFPLVPFLLLNCSLKKQTTNKTLKISKSVYSVTEDRRLGVILEFLLFHLHPNKCRVQVVLLLKHILEFSLDSRTLVLTQGPRYLSSGSLLWPRTAPPPTYMWFPG